VAPPRRVRQALSHEHTDRSIRVSGNLSGSWDENPSADDIHNITDQFYAWYGRLITEGKIKADHRLRDGPFAESKEEIGGYWFILANSLEEAAQIATVDYGIITEVRSRFRSCLGESGEEL
jgi:YCII-related domain-containing protein